MTANRTPLPPLIPARILICTRAHQFHYLTSIHRGIIIGKPADRLIRAIHIYLQEKTVRTYWDIYVINYWT